MSGLEHRQRNARVAALMRARLPEAGQIELDNILEDARRRNLDIDPLAIASEIFKGHIVPDAPLPPHLTAVAEASGGRWYGLTLSANPCDAAAMTALRPQYIDECKYVLAETERGISIEEAWESIRRSGLKR